MTADQVAALQDIEQARQAMKQGDKHAARRLAEQAARRAPELEEPWLLLAALAPPRASMAYLERALQINPRSEHAQKGMAWARERLRQEASKPGRPVSAQAPKKKGRSRLRVSYLLLALVFLCLGVSTAAFIITNPATAQIGNQFFASLPQGEKVASVEVADDAEALTPTPLPTETPTATFTVTLTLSPTATLTFTPSPTATATLTETPTLTPTETPTEQDTPTPLPTDTPEPIPPTVALPAPAMKSSSGGGGVKWIEVDLSDQMLYAWEGKTLVASFVVSTGAAPYRTITGSYPIYEKHVKANMWGPGYFFPDVPYTMYFHKGYGIHGTYWHNNFGTPMSHGCVNMSIPDAKWLYYWASIGTSVKVHQ
jgi:lipoprotein-anchoring transpeptidase ErfK/SrfK